MSTNENMASADRHRKVLNFLKESNKTLCHRVLPLRTFNGAFPRDETFKGQFRILDAAYFLYPEINID